ncbi:MAG: hypothetical protein A2270_00710 [Elusimicrobia bacterium RIFOXYA12_FULL_51_18]|nr:MAG: hypothetical protein A2270_00710 [Elusimicrobia bacterium RIFOXYA12_FULL_51_18]OGS29019.1 MAG: hypothetical protein A2218_08725 [Elusimicrobia bacterium RIFOXYA2_FULL_53_38]
MRNQGRPGFKKKNLLDTRVVDVGLCRKGRVDSGGRDLKKLGNLLLCIGKAGRCPIVIKTYKQLSAVRICKGYQSFGYFGGNVLKMFYIPGNN